MGADMPHLAFMEEHNLSLNNFSDSIRSKCALFDSEFAIALSDGIVDGSEFDSLHALSSQLRDLLEKELRPKPDAENGALITCVIAIGAALGLNKIFRS